MQDTPDLSKIVNVIMQNPSLIEEISSIISSKDDKKDVREDEGSDKVSPGGDEEKVKEVYAVPLMKTHRRDLLNAMKPYLSESRKKAIDSMSSILDVIDVMARR